MTDLPNRRLFEERLDEAISAALRHDACFALMYIDLDRFKPVNDAFGHAAGVLLLKQAARRLTRACKEEDTVARLGGDEFTVLLRQVDTQERVTEIAARILREFQQPFDLDGPRALVGASIGIAMAPVHGTERADLMRKADDALYRAKREGRNRFVVHQADGSEGGGAVPLSKRA